MIKHIKMHTKQAFDNDSYNQSMFLSTRILVPRLQDHLFYSLLWAQWKKPKNY